MGICVCLYGVLLFVGISDGQKTKSANHESLDAEQIQPVDDMGPFSKARPVESTLVRPGRISHILGSRSSSPAAAVLSDNTAQIPSLLDAYVTSNGIPGTGDNPRDLALSIPMEISHEDRPVPPSSPDIAEHTLPLWDHGHGLNEL